MLTTSSLVRRFQVGLIMLLAVACLCLRPGVADAQLMTFISTAPCGGLPAGYQNVWIMNADGTGVQPVTSSSINATHPDLSPDGTRIVFALNGDIWGINTDGTGLTQLTTDGNTNDNANPAWSPDKTKIVFRKSGDIYVMNADGSSPSQLTSYFAPGQSDNPCWSPDGSEIAFVHGPNGSDGIWQIPATGGTPTQVTAPNSGDYACPTYSPDGKWIAYESDSSGAWEIYATDGSHETQFSCTAGFISAASGASGLSWIPNGQYIYFSAGNTGASPIYRVDVSTCAVDTVLSNGYTNKNPSFGFGAKLMGFLTPPTVIGGKPFLITIMLKFPEPQDTPISLFSNNSAIQLPPTVIVPAGQSSVSVGINTTPVTRQQKPTIGAYYIIAPNEVPFTKTITLKPIGVQSLTLAPNTVTSGNSSTGILVLDCAAGSGGDVVYLSSSNSSIASVPASVTVVAGSSCHTFPITTYQGVPGTATITAKAQGSTVPKRATLTVYP